MRPVYIRAVHIDPLLVASGLDSAAVRATLIDLLRNADLLADDSLPDTPAMDVDLTATVRASVGAPGAVGFASVDVGRNRMEAGTAVDLLWRGSESLRDYPTLRALAAVLPDRLFQLIRDYINGPKPSM